MIQTSSDIDLSKKLIKWYSTNKRDLPWRKTKDPYSVWVSEIILQQTRIETGIRYYLNFIKKYPNVKFLARSSKQQLLKSWEGLGYYSRARNLKKTAQSIIKNLEGKLPDNLEDLLKLPGIGKETLRLRLGDVCFCF